MRITEIFASQRKNRVQENTMTRDLRIVFFAFESNLESNRPSDSISNRIFESNRPYPYYSCY